MRKESIITIAIAVLAAVLRFGGLTQGESDFVPSATPGAAAYYHFHPDEETLVRAALRLESLFDPWLTVYKTSRCFWGAECWRWLGCFRTGLSKSALKVVRWFFRRCGSFRRYARWRR